MNKMKFMKGDIVEVRRVDSSNFHSWFRARVISGDKYSYKVQYENVSNAEGKSIVEDVYAEAVRSESPDINSTKMLAIGHMIEPYDTRLSKSRKVVKTLRRRPFVKLMETQQQETYQMISQGEKWIHKDKGDRDLLMETGFQPPKKSYNGFQVQNQSMKMNAGKQKYGQPEAKLYPHKCSTYNAKRKRGSQMHFVNNEDFLKTEAAPHKRRSRQSFRQQGEYAQSSYPILEKDHLRLNSCLLRQSMYRR